MYDFSVDYHCINVNDILDIHKYLTRKIDERNSWTMWRNRWIKWRKDKLIDEDDELREEKIGRMPEEKVEPSEEIDELHLFYINSQKFKQSARKSLIC